MPSRANNGNKLQKKKAMFLVAMCRRAGLSASCPLLLLLPVVAHAAVIRVTSPVEHSFEHNVDSLFGFPPYG